VPKIFLSAGDLSGDIHCGLLIRELLRRHPDWELSALGGKHMEAAGASLIGDTTGLGVIGFTSALATVPRTLALKKKALRWVTREKPDVAVLCDWGGFNTRILEELRSLQIPILYYFPPRSWQKQGNGGLAIIPFCERIATPFQWSADRLVAAGGKAEWVGHPLLETVRPSKPREELRREFGAGPENRLVTLMPGSRALEVSYIASHVATAAGLLEQRYPDLRFVIPAPSGGSSRLRGVFPAHYSIAEGRTADVLLASDFAIVKSGTSTLEAAVADVPQIVVYDVPQLLHLQIKLTGLQRKVPFVAMPNIILERGAIPELLGENCRGPIIADTLARYLENSSEVAGVRDGYKEVRRALGEGLPYTATNRTADMVAEIVAQTARS
jgi:lipid-A-disaccharide synthase